ncbi:Subtilisin-like protease SDD1 [Platanthera zijinensis]|uniref:Subtilisin-like protease SDD1 n=1 Tax=Platanthera zijinensis TaxID=2320716 RepID=A0AAP0BAQ3_9ASPA
MPEPKGIESLFISLSRAAADYGSGVIIGILDTAVDATHPSFNDNGMPPPPPYWKGECDSLHCNNKIIGSKSFNRGRAYNSASADNNGTEHGTHVASISAGVFVEDANVLGSAEGVSVGMAPKAHLAIYQVCSEDECADSDVLAGIDRAIYDEVDLISVSFGSAASRPFYEDSVAIGSYSALRHRILTVAAAGNSGPAKGSVANDAPWILTVGASTTDRRIAVTVKLGDGTELVGESAYQPSSFNSTETLPLVFPDFQNPSGGKGCRNDSFNGVDVSGKIVLCEVGFGVKNIEKGENVKSAGGAAMILLNQVDQGETTLSEAHVLPAAHLSYSARCSMVFYYNSSKSSNSTPTAAIVFNGTRFGTPASPAVASFSSHGPSPNNGGIMKPDTIGPGVNILGAWPSKVGPNHLSITPESNFNFQSGTSVATPHLSGIAALLRSSHPHWSASAIKSAIMTTADTNDGEGNPITDQRDNSSLASRFSTGAGQVNPGKANNPGLVYNLRSHEYKPYLCGLGYTNRQVTMITQHHVNCLRYRRELGPEQLNYPSISVALGPHLMKTVRRWVKNVGEGNATYYAKIEMPRGVKVEAYPARLYFARRYDSRRFQLVLTANSSSLSPGQVAVGQLSWVSPDHIVKSVISITSA